MYRGIIESLNPLLIGVSIPSRDGSPQDVCGQIQSLNPLLIGVSIPSVIVLVFSFAIALTSQSPSHRGLNSFVKLSEANPGRTARLNPLLIGVSIPS